MNRTEKQAAAILNNLNWLMAPHNSSVELIEIKGSKVIIRCIGSCRYCETDCIRAAFKDSMPDIELIIK